MPRETRCTAGDETYRGRRVGSGRRGKTEWGKGVPLTDHCVMFFVSGSRGWGGIPVTYRYFPCLPASSALSFWTSSGPLPDLPHLSRTSRTPSDLFPVSHMSSTASQCLPPRSLLCPAGSDRNQLEPVGFRSEILDHSIGQTVGNFSNFSNRIPIRTSGTGRFYRFQVQSIPTGTRWNRSEPVRKSQTSAYIVGDHLIIF